MARLESARRRQGADLLVNHLQRFLKLLQAFLAVFDLCPYQLPLVEQNAQFGLWPEEVDLCGVSGRGCIAVASSRLCLLHEA